jgi:hypothetical protein
MIKRYVLLMAAALSTATPIAMGAEDVTDRLMPSGSMALPWVIGAGILVLTLIAGFKNPGRTHLD